MAVKRMFNLTIVDTDKFLEMPISARLLYYELGMRADDDGFVGNFKKILAFTGLKENDLKILINKDFIIPFESGVILIKHWRLNNNLQKDRIKPTIYQEEFNKIKKNDSGVYELYTACIQNVSNLDTTCIHSIDKYSIVENSIDKYSINTIVHSANARECFEKLWSLYPKKVGKKKAFDKYMKIRNKVSDEKIEQGIKKYVEYIKSRNIDEKYIKNGLTWFNGEYWDDDYKISGEIEERTETKGNRVWQ